MKRFAIIWSLVMIVGGCNGLFMRSQNPDEPLTLDEGPHIKLVGDLAVPTGLEPLRVEAINLVGGLNGTGSDPGPSPQRAALLDEMQKRGVDKPNMILASGNVSMVMVRGWLKAGIQEGDHFDVEVRTVSHSETTSLRGGTLFESRLKQMMVLGNQMHDGHVLALAKGAVLVDPSAGPNDKVLLCRGRILGGGVALKSRPIGLVLTPGNQSVLNSSRVANAVNRRFHVFRGGLKTGMAKGKTDEFIELEIHPRYKDNLTRYVRVVRALPISETASERKRRVDELEKMLLDPKTSSEAAIGLEALGKHGEDILLKGLKSQSAEIRFYAAESLAYLDRREAAEPLAQIARDYPAFRVFALSALSVIGDYVASEELAKLLSAPSAETRYGAFRALWSMNENDPLVKGEMMGGKFHYHLLETGGPPMIHVTRNRLPEIVVFGADQKLEGTFAIEAGNEIMITCRDGSEISVSKYTVGQADQKRIVSSRIDDVIRAIADLGGTYPDVVQALQEAKNCGALASRFEVDALPEAGRTFDRIADNPDETEQASPDSPSPDMFRQMRGDKKASGPKEADSTSENGDSEEKEEKPAKKKSFFARMLGRG